MLPILHKAIINQSLIKTILNFTIFWFLVNFAHDQGLRGKATMGALPQRPAWSADKAVDGNTSQYYASDSCAITDIKYNRNTKNWWKVWLQRSFNVAYLEIYFRVDSK